MSEGQQPAVSVVEAPTRSGWSMALWGLVALLAHLALVDAAVETFWSGSPLRWWVSPAILLLAVLSVWLWRPGGTLLRRFGPAGAAATPVIGLLALLAGTAWLPAGQDFGVRVLFLPTTRLLTVVLALAVLLGTLVLLRAVGALTGSRRLAAQVFIGVVAIYALAALGVAIRDDRPFAALFQGGAVWERLPRWLQGTTLGSLLLVPLAILAQLGGIVAHLRRRLPVGRLVHETTALVMAVVMATSGLGLPASSRGSAVASSKDAPQEVATGLSSYEQSTRKLAEELTGLDRRQPPQRAKIEQRLEDTFDALQEIVDTAGHREFDVSAVVQRTGTDSEKLFEWVRDNTGWVPYRGALRGAKGVLLERKGNSLDRALLLSALLKEAGWTARLAHGTLPAAKVEELLKGAAPVPQARAEDSVSLASLPKLSVLVGNTQPAIESADAVRRATGARVVETTRREADTQAALLLRAVKPDATSESMSEASSAAADHWWVQVEADGTWNDLDPALPRNRLGIRLAEPDETVKPADLPDAMQHQVAVRVVIEQLAAGRLAEHVVLEEKLNAADLIGVPLRFSNIPLNAKPTASDFAGKSPSQAIVEWARAEKVWVPALNVGDRSVTRGAFATTGETLKPRAKRAGPSASDLAGGLSGLLGGEGDKPQAAPGDDQARAEGSPDGELTGEWLEYEIRVPGKPVRTVRREVFDLLGPAVRRTGGSLPTSISDADRVARGMALLTQTELAVLAGQLPVDYLQWLRGRAFLSNRPLLTRVARTPEASRASVLFDGLRTLQSLPGPEFDFAVARARWSPVATSTYLSEPNLFAYHRGLTASGPGRPTAFHALDVVWNPVAVIPSRRDVSFETRLQQGVFDSVLEGTVVTGSCCSIAGDATSGALWAGRAEGAAWTSVRSEKDVGNLKLSADTKARMVSAVDAGAIVVTPAVAVQQPTVWWRVDRASGQTVAIGPRGWGGSITESALLKAFERWLESAAGHFIMEAVMFALCATFSIMIGVAAESPGEGIVGTLMCVIAAGVGSFAALMTQGEAFAEMGLLKAVAAADSQVSVVSWIGVIIEAIHAAISWMGRSEHKGQGGE
jgi:hypothetical protein